MAGRLNNQTMWGTGHLQLSAVIFAVLCPSQRMLSGRAAKITALTYYRAIVQPRSRRPFNGCNNQRRLNCFAFWAFYAFL